MPSVVADTHTLIWYIFELPRLSPAALTALEQAVNEGNFIYFSAITIVEISYLIERGRLAGEVLTRVLNAADDPSNCGDSASTFGSQYLGNYSTN